MKLRNRVSCDFINSRSRVLVIFVILIFKFNYGLCNQETGDNSDTISTADSIYNDIMLNDETFKFYDNVDELTANILNDTVTEYSNDEEEIDEENLKSLMENYDKAYTNETWIVAPKDGDIVETIQDIVEEFETGPIEEIVIVTQDDDNVGISRKQHDDLQFGFEIVAGTTVILIDTTTENNQNEIFDEDVEKTTERENGFEVRSDELDTQTTEVGEVEYRNEEPEFSTRSESQDNVRSEDFEPQTTENVETTSAEPDANEFRNDDLELTTTDKEELIEYITSKFESQTTELDKHNAELDELENEDLLIDELDPIIIALPKPEAPKPSYEDYTTEEETTTHIDDTEGLIGHKIYLHEPEVTIDYNVMIIPESTTSKPVLVPEVFPTTEEIESLETTPKPNILQKISSYMYGIFNYRFAKGEGRNLEIDPDDSSTEIFDDFVTTSYNTDRKRVEEQSIIEIEKILDPEVKNEFIKDIVIDKSPDVLSIFKKPDESNIINRGQIVLDADNIDVEKFSFDKINRDGKSSAEYDEEIIDNNLYSNPVQNSRINHVPVETKHEDKTIIEIEKIIDPEIQNEFIKDIPPSSDHTAENPIIEVVKVMDNTDGDTEIHMTERNIEKDGRLIHDENKVESIDNSDHHRVIHENIHIVQANDTRTEDRTKVEIETVDVDRVEVQHVIHKEDENDQHTEQKTEHVTIDEPGFHMENHETIETTKSKNGDVTDTQDIITKDLGNVHVVEKIKIHEDNSNVYVQLLEREDEIKKNKNKIGELKKEIDILKEDIKKPNELIAYEAELLKKTGYLPDKIELIADYLNFREHQLYGNADDVGLKRYLQRLTKERELDILKLKKDKLKKQLFDDYKEFMSAEQKFGIRLDDEIEKSVEKFDEESKSSGSINSKSKSESSMEDDDSKEGSEERVWNSFVSQARLAAEERVQRREEEVKLLERVLNDDSTTEISLDHITLPSFVSTTPVPVLFPDIDKESQIILLETLVRLPNIENAKDLRNLPVTTELPINTNAPITEEISIEIDEIEKMVDDQSHIVKVVDKRVLLHNSDNKLEIDETIDTQSGDTQIEVHNKRVQNIDDKTRSRILEVLMPKLREKSLKKHNSTRQGEGRSLSDEPAEEIVPPKTEESPILDDGDDDSVITNEALRTVVEGVELTSEIARSVDNFRSPIEKINEILTATDQTLKTKTPNELADEIGRAEEILGIEENKIVAEIAELELVGVNLALILFCILCTFLILVITIIFFLRKSKRLSGLNFIPV